MMRCQMKRVFLAKELWKETMEGASFLLGLGEQSNFESWPRSARENRGWAHDHVAANGVKVLEEYVQYIQY